MNSGITIAAAALLFACGSRSALLDGRSAGGGGDSGSGGGGGSGAGSGDTPGCQLAPVSPAVDVASTGNEAVSSPAFVAPPDDPAKVTLAFVRRPNADPWAPSALAHLTFTPWGTWPPDPELGSSFAAFTSANLGEDFRITSSLPGSFAAAAVESGIVHFAPKVSESSPGNGIELSLLGTKPLFASALDDEAFVIGTLSIQRELYVQIADSTLQDPVPIATIGCADDELVGGAVPFSNGWLLAHSNGTNAPPAVCEPTATANAGSARRIDIVKLEESSITELLTNLEAAAWVSELVVAPHPDGISFAWIDGALHFARYVAKTGALVGPVVVAEAADSPSGLAMTAFGARFLVTYRRDLGQPELVTKLLDASGTERASFSMAPDFVGKAAVIANPAGYAALLSYASDSTGQIELTRLECAP